jgi:hypothetical protein
LPLVNDFERVGVAGGRGAKSPVGRRVWFAVIRSAIAWELFANLSAGVSDATSLNTFDSLMVVLTYPINVPLARASIVPQSSSFLSRVSGPRDLRDKSCAAETGS